MLGRFFLSLDGVLVIPRQPPFRLMLDVIGMLLKYDQVIEDIHVGCVCGGDHGSDDISVDGTGGRFEKQGVYSSSNDQLQCLLDGLVVDGAEPLEPACKVKPS